MNDRKGNRPNPPQPERRSRSIASASLFEQSTLGEAGKKPLEYRSHRLCHRERTGGDQASKPLQTHFPKPAGELRSGEVIARGHGCLELFATACRDHLLEGFSGDLMQPAEWDRPRR